MADKTDDLEQLLLELPERTLTHDAPIAADDLGADAFELHKRLGRVYDAIRHPDTKTPLAIGIFGDWGTGKTSAMRGLDGRLQRWSKKNPAKDKQGDSTIRLLTAWFYPWKYQDREDVWRGLLAEVILACLNRSPATLKKIPRRGEGICEISWQQPIRVLDRVGSGTGRRRRQNQGQNPKRNKEYHR
ncbi:MAG: P-loop NTPase fold protein [Rhodospirillales bacterium]